MNMISSIGYLSPRSILHHAGRLNDPLQQLQLSGSEESLKSIARSALQSLQRGDDVAVTLRRIFRIKLSSETITMKKFSSYVSCVTSLNVHVPLYVPKYS